MSARSSRDWRVAGVCIYGEMVDVLAARGDYKAAHQLEELWDDLGRRESFTLDLLAEYLLEQPAIQSSRDASAPSPLS